MSLTLDANLATAQDSQSRHPICEIISAQNSDDIPFDGSFLTNDSTIREYGMNAISHSSGRLCLSYAYYTIGGFGGYGIRYVYTSEDRSIFNFVSLSWGTVKTKHIYRVSLCELTNGNIGLAYTYLDGSTVYLASRILTVDGVAVAGSIKAIGNWATTVYHSGSHVSTIGDNSYIMVYAKQNGSNYYIYKRTSSDFLTWSSESALSIGGIDTTFQLSLQNGPSPYILKDNSNNLWLWFDVVEDTAESGTALRNVYYSISSDNGASWGNATKFTDYSLFGTAGYAPCAVQKTATTMHVIYNEVISRLFMNSSFENWPVTSYSNEVSELSWDQIHRKLYVISYRYELNKWTFIGVMKVDVDTWTVDQYWNTGTTPAFDAKLAQIDIRRRGSFAVHDGEYIVIYKTTAVASPYPQERILELLDGEANTITSYDLTPTTGNVANVPDSYYRMGQPFVDKEHDKIWLTFTGGTVAYQRFYIGYIDLTEESDYEFHKFYQSNNFSTTDGFAQSMDSYGALGGYTLDYTNNLLIITTGFSSTFNDGMFIAIDLSTGAVVHETYMQGNIYSAPLVYNGKVYCGKGRGVLYDKMYDLAEIDLTTGEEKLITLYYIDDDPGGMSRPIYISGDKIAYIHEPYGIIVFDVVTRDYDIFSNDTVRNFTGDHVNPAWASQLVYDETNELIFFGHPNSVNAGLYAFSINGDLTYFKYSVGTYSGEAWSFSEPTVMVQEYREYYPIAVVEPGSESAMYLFWNNITFDENGAADKYSIKWDKDGSSMDITSYLVGEVTTEHSINGDPASLSFNLSHGHLFDPHNINSLYRFVCDKGRKITLRWGEDVGGVEYWNNAGTFYITETSLSFERGKYPTISVRAEDQRCFWNIGHIYATSIYTQQTPKTVIDGILNAQGGLDEADRNIPAISTSLINYQGMENTIVEMIDHICGRFGYYFRFDVDGKAHAKQISNELDVDHTYTDNTKLLNYTPDDRYSDFTNRVTVRGQSLDFTEVTFSEERITDISGTLGWWGCKADHVVWFSEDKSRRVINPRLVTIETATSIAFQLAGNVEEYLEECGSGDDDKYCTVYVSAPNLIPVLIAAIAMYGAGAMIGDIVIVEGFIVSGGITIPLGRAMEYAALLIIVNVLGSVANYNLEIWGQPLGLIRNSYQESADDIDHQTKIGQVIEQVIDESLCYTVDDCLEVAEFELMVVQMQRQRIRIKKIAHIQDEDGDTIRIVHPYGGENIDLYITNLRRSFKRGKDGYFYDEIEGWVC